jgi:hypothetical protein
MKNISGNAGNWLIEENIDNFEKNEKTYDEKEFNKFIKDSKHHFSKFKINIEQIYDLKKKKEYYDIISGISAIENLVTDLN